MEQTAKYIQIAKTLQRDILAGKYESHSRFPSEEMLARHFGASRPALAGSPFTFFKCEREPVDNFSVIDFLLVFVGFC